MSQRELSEEEKAKIANKVPVIADLFVRLGRNYVACVRVDSRDQNQGAHSRLEQAIYEAVVLGFESGLFD